MIIDTINNKARKRAIQSLHTLSNYRFGLPRHTIQNICYACQIDRGYEYDDEWWFSDIRDIGGTDTIYHFARFNKQVAMAMYRKLTKLKVNTISERRL